MAGLSGFARNRQEAFPPIGFHPYRKRSQTVNSLERWACKTEWRTRCAVFGVWAIFALFAIVCGAWLFALVSPR